MKGRCLSPKSSGFKFYGGKGIKVCKRWMKFDNFLKDMGLRPLGFSIERKNPKGNYKPSNCCWIPMSEQNNNRSNSVFLTLNGKRKTVSQWSRKLKINKNVLYNRSKKGWTSQKILTTPTYGQFYFVNITYNGKTQNARKWSKETGITYHTILQRVKSGWTSKEALTTPIDNRRNWRNKITPVVGREVRI